MYHLGHKSLEWILTTDKISLSNKTLLLSQVLLVLFVGLMTSTLLWMSLSQELMTRQTMTRDLPIYKGQLLAVR